MSNPNLNDNEDWANYLTKKLNLDAYDSETLIHDLNNFRADEWLDSVVDAGIPTDIIDQFKSFFHITSDDEE